MFSFKNMKHNISMVILFIKKKDIAYYCSENNPYPIIYYIQNNLISQPNPREKTKQIRKYFSPRRLCWRKTWQSTLVFCLETPHGQRSLAGYSSCGHKESDTTEVTKENQQGWWTVTTVYLQRSLASGWNFIMLTISIISMILLC